MAVVAIAAMLLIRVVFVLFPFADLLMSHSDFGPSLVGIIVLLVSITVQVLVTRGVLRGDAPSRRLAVLVVVEFALTLAPLFLLGERWVAVAIFGLVDVLLCLRGRARFAVVASGITVYTLGAAALFPVVTLMAVLAEFTLGTFMLFVLLRLVVSQRQLEGARTELAELAIIHDRQRMSRDLHDTVGQTLTVATIRLEVARTTARANSAMLDDELVAIRALLQQTATETRQAVYALRRSSLADEITSARCVLAAAGIHASISVARVDLSPLAEEALGWVLREGTTNVLKHSAATRCEIVLGQSDVDGGVVRLRMMNNGSSRHDGAAGHGLRGLQERLELVRGGLTLTREADIFVLAADVSAASAITPVLAAAEGVS